MTDLGIKVIAKLNEMESTVALQRQLDTIAKKLNLNVGVDDKQLKEVLNTLQVIEKQSSKSGKGVKVVDEENVQQSKKIFTDVEAAVNKFKQLGTVKVKKIFDPATQELKGFNLEVQKADGLIEKLKFESAKLKNIHGVNGFVMTGRQEVDNRALQSEKVLQKTIENRIRQEKQAEIAQAQAINRTIELTEKEKIKQKEVSQEIQRQLRLFKERQKIQADDLKRRYSDAVDKNKLDSHLQSLDVDPKSFKNLKDLRKWQQEAELGFKKISSSVKASTSHMVSFGQQMEIAFSRTIIWTAATTAIFGGLQVLTQWYETLMLIDEKLIAIQKVTDTINIAETLEVATENAYRFGRTIDGALTAMEEISKLGFSAKDAQQLSENSLLLSTIGDIGDADAANYLVAIMRQYRLEIADTAEVVDILNELSNKTGSSVLDLAQALSKSSATAQTAGISMNELAAMSATIVETLKISGNEAGNFLKALSTRILRESTLTDLEELGIKVRENNGDIVSATEIIRSLSEVWGDLSETQRNSISQALGGVYHINKVTALIEQQANVMKYTTMATEAYGSGLRELATFEEGLQFKTNVLRTSFQELAMTISEVGGRSILVTLIESLTTMVQSFNELTAATNGWNIKLPILVAGLYGLYKGLILVSTAAKGVQLSLGWIAAGVVGFQLLGSALVGVTKTNAEATDSFIEASNTYTENAGRLEVLAKRYDELKPQLEGNSKAQAEYKQVLDEIAQIAPQVTEVTGKYGDVLDINRGKLDQYTESLKTMSDEQLRNATILLENSLVTAQNELDKLQRKQAESSKEVQEQFDFVQEMNNKYGVSTVSEFADAVNNFTEKNGVLSKESRQMLNDFGDYNEILTLHSKDLTEYAEIMDQVSQKETEVGDIKARQQELRLLNTDYQELSKTIKETFDGRVHSNIFGDFDKSQLTALIQFGDSIKDNKNSIEESLPILEKAKIAQEDIDAIVTSLTSKVYVNSESYEQLSDSASNAAGSVDDLSNALDRNISSSELLLGVTEDQLTKMQRAVQIVQTLATVENLSANQKALLAQATSFLVGMYPHLNGEIAENIGYIQGEIEAMNLLNGASGKNADVLMSNQIAITDTAISAINSRIAAYKKEIDALLRVAQAQSAVADMNGEGTLRVPRGLQYLSQALNGLYASRGRLERRKASYGGWVNTDVSTGGGSSRSGSGRSDDAAKRLEDEQKARMDAIKNRIDDFERMKSIYDAEIAYQEYIADSVEETSDEYRNAQKEILKYQNLIKQKHQQEISYIQKELSTNRKLTSEQRKELQSILEDKQAELWSIAGTIQKTQEAIRDSYESVADSVVDAMKDYYDKRKQLETDAIDDQLDLAEKAHRERMDLLDDELDSYRKAADEKLRLIRDENETDDYNEELTRKQVDRQELLDRINALSLDDSMEGQARLAELREQLAEQDRDIMEFTRDRERNLREQSIMDDVTAKEEQIEREKAIQDEALEALRQRLESEKEAIQTHYDEILESERHWAEIREQIMSGNVTNLVGILGSFVTDASSNMKDLGNAISENLTDKLKESLNLLKQVKEGMTSATKVTSPPSSSSGSKPSSGGTSSTPSPRYHTVRDGDTYWDLAGKYYGDPHQWQKIFNANKIDPRKLVIGSRLLIPFEEGGYTGNWAGNGGKLALLHKKEQVFKEDDTKNLLKVMELMHNFKTNLLNPNIKIPKLPSFTGNQGNTISIHMPIKIGSLNGTKEGVNDFFSEINNALKEQGVVFKL